MMCWASFTNFERYYVMLIVYNQHLLESFSFSTKSCTNALWTVVEALSGRDDVTCTSLPGLAVPADVISFLASELSASDVELNVEIGKLVSKRKFLTWKKSYWLIQPLSEKDRRIRPF